MHTQVSSAMSAEFLEDMSIIDDLYTEYGDADDPNEIGKRTHVVRTALYRYGI
jgi:hypothetical protein